ncbi:MAG: proline hydroxylase [Acidobacteriia bacterium]|nr:proline hydroxylase [Terriglobia bacterium]
MDALIVPEAILRERIEGMMTSRVSAVRFGACGVQGADKFVAGRVEFHIIQDFLDERECLHLIELARTNLSASNQHSRTGRTCDLGRSSDPVVCDVDARLCRLFGLNPSSAEPMQCKYYEAGDEPGPGAVCTDDARTWTASIYLNDPERAGEVRFGGSGCVLRPRRGTALIWNRLAPNSSPGPNGVQQELPVLAGFKAVLTKSLRIPDPDCASSGEESTLPPAYTRLGFHRCAVPGAVFDVLRTFYEHNAANAVDEHVPGYIAGDQAVASHLLQLPPALQRHVHDALHLTMEQWSRTALMPTYVYGIRRYLRGATLKVHRDRSSTHVFGATLNIAQQVDEPWPLIIEDHLSHKHEVALQPGEMLLYESERLLHGRPKPLRGEFYAGAFAHYRPCRGEEVARRTLGQ